ncbi:MAG TPA: outer membrane beta-barrel protein [Steroidobacteraceae bacterium]|jgi:opacity protein-like surface antigen|nr:outer membrane beta-barrel protein [Steroidobacteraceae bacterium]
MLAAACLSCSGMASAAESAFYVAVDVGLVEPSVSASDGFQVFATGVPISVLPQETRVRGTAMGWSGLVGYRVNRYLAGEFGYVNFGSVDIEETYDLSEFSPPLPPTTVLRSVSEVQGPTVSALGILPIDQDRFEVFVRAGMLFADQTLKGDLGVARGVELDNEQDLWLIGAGLAFRPASQWSARLEYQAVDELRANTMTGSIRMWRISLGVVRQF